MSTKIIYMVFFTETKSAFPLSIFGPLSLNVKEGRWSVSQSRVLLRLVVGAGCPDVAPDIQSSGVLITDTRVQTPELSTCHMCCLSSHCPSYPR